MGSRPTIALTLGDPAGVGPELCARAAEDASVRAAARLVLLGPARLAPRGVPELGGASAAELAAFPDVCFLDTGADGAWELGRPQRAAGRAALAALQRGAELAAAGAVDALVTAPVSKEALWLAGERVEGQTQLLARWAGCEDVEMLAIARELRVLLLTRHVPLARAIASLSTEDVVRKLELLARSLPLLGFERPRLALAGLNPHAGEHGLLGSEEQTLLEPAVAAARAVGIDVTGPLSPDTVFLRAAQGEFDAVLALYHDQAFIPVKLWAPREGMTVLCGLSYLRVSPAHGTAFDLAGTGRADPESLFSALRQAAVWAQSAARWRAASAKASPSANPSAAARS